MSLFQSGQCEGLKGGYHAALGLLALGAVGYNAVAWWNRRRRHLAVNAGIYALLTAWEIHKVLHHREGLRGSGLDAGTQASPRV